MNKKIIGIFVMMLLVCTIIPLSTTADDPIRKTVTVDDDSGADYTNIEETIDNAEAWDIGTYDITISTAYDLQVLEMTINNKPIFEGDNILISGEVINRGKNLSPSYTVKNQLYKNGQHYHTFNDEDFEPLSSESWRGFGPQSNETNEDDAGIYKLVTTIQVDEVTVDEEEEYFFVWSKKNLEIITSQPRVKIVQSQIFMRLIERFPNAFPILRQLLSL